MSILVLEHDAAETAAALGVTLAQQGHELRVLRLHDRQPLPPDLDDVDGIVSMGGPANVDQEDQFPWLGHERAYLQRAHEAGVPIVGVCLGAQMVATALGGEVGAMATPEVGWGNVRLAFPGTIDPVLAGIAWNSTQFHLHAQEVTQLPPGATPLAGSQACRNQAFKVGMRTYAFQYHFEWTADVIREIARQDSLAQANGAAHAIIDGLDDFYTGYRRQGDRLSEQIALFLFPVDTRS